MEEILDLLTRLHARIEALETRVSLLEHPIAAPAVLAAPSRLALPVVTSSSFAQSGTTFTVLGRSLLGMAGAYLLRAVAESGSFPKLAAVVLALAYAGTWLVLAARLPAQQWFAATAYAGTSALILAPMLWEFTLRYKFLSPASDAAILAVFVLAAYTLAWKRDLTSVLWVANLTAAIAAIALLIATHDLEPFLGLLLLLALLSEISACRNRWLSLRPIVAIAADLAAWSLLYIYANPDRSLADYANLSTMALLTPATLLFFIYASSVTLRTIVLRHRITLFEAGQSIVAFLLAVDTLDRFAPASVILAFGAFCMAIAIAGYATVSLRQFPEPRNYRVLSSWSLALLLLGCWICLPAPWLASALGIAAIVAMSSGAGTHRLTLAFHGLIYLFAAGYTSGLAQYAAHTMAGAFPQPPDTIVWIIAATTILCYAIAGQIEESRWQPQLFHTLAAALAVACAATALVSLAVQLTATEITPGSPHVAVIRTLTASALALALAWLGPRWRREELIWLAYATIAAIAAKLLFEDLPLSHPQFIAVSIFLFAATLILVPQIVRKSNAKWHSAPRS